MPELRIKVQWGERIYKSSKQVSPYIDCDELNQDDLCCLEDKQRRLTCFVMESKYAPERARNRE